jgi:hypothetical protein
MILNILKSSIEISRFGRIASKLKFESSLVLETTLK